ncbi:hypothetical protein ES705_40001 [subsurface metagenome]
MCCTFALRTSVADIICDGGKRDRICAALEKGGFNPYIPEGAYYVLADSSGEEIARFCFAKDDTVLDRACEKIAGLR